jgi:hypothetical protein
MRVLKSQGRCLFSVSRVFLCIYQSHLHFLAENCNAFLSLKILPWALVLTSGTLASAVTISTSVTSCPVAVATCNANNCLRAVSLPQFLLILLKQCGGACVLAHTGPIICGHRLLILPTNHCDTSNCVRSLLRCLRFLTISQYFNLLRLHHRY